MKAWFGWVGIGLGLAIAAGAVVAVKLRTDRAIAVVNGEKIPRGVFIAEMERQHGATILRRMIQERLILQAAKKKGVLPSPADVQKEIADMRELEPDMDRQLRINGKTVEDLQNDIQGRMATANLIAAEVTLPEAEARKLFDRNQRQFNRPEARKIAMILAKTKEAGEKARRLLADGIPAEFAAQNEGMALPGGRGQMILYRGQLPSSFEKQVFSLKAGSISNVLTMGKMFAIVKVLEEIPARRKRYDEVKDKLLLLAKMQKGKSQPELLQSLTKQAKIDITSDRYKGLKDVALAAGDPRAGRRRVAQTAQ